ncbi:hypothetical protein [Streptosporangium sp. CA-115845]|uniref:hypothetical protein n=1 Tax=Streptosporangium sp. CA-115845 TaxID=3240071 RepID=UPI003D8DD625
MWDPTLVDGVVPIPTADAEEMAGRLAREEGLCTGTSSPRSSRSPAQTTAQS